MAGDTAAATELGMDLLEGVRGSRGRTIVRRNSRAAVQFLRQAANAGDLTAACSLGYAYDVGLGVDRNIRLAVYWYRRAALKGYGPAAVNLATIYRDAGKSKQAFQWWNLAASRKDGDAAVDAAYCFQYGIGIRRDPVEAKRLYRMAMRSRNISGYGREAAMYHSAVELIDEGKMAPAIRLLKRASSDGDFPEATSVLRQFRSGVEVKPCRCRRFIKKTLLGHARCLVHAQRSPDDCALQ